MSDYIVNCSLDCPIECSFEITDRQLDVMVANGVDVLDEFAVSDFYRKHLGQEIGGVYFMDLFRIKDYENSAYPPEITDWSIEGEAPERFWPDDEVPE